MSRLECLGKSSTGLQKQLAVEVTSAHVETHKPNDKVEKKAATDKPCRSYPARALPPSAQVSQQEIQTSGFQSGDVLNTSKCSPKESINITPRDEEQAQSDLMSDDELKMKGPVKAPPSDSAVTGGTTHAFPAAESTHAHEVGGEEDQAEKDDEDEYEDEDEEEELKAPVELIIKFLRAVMDKDFRLASKLCQMILIFEPDHPEASEFLPLIRKKLLEQQEEEPSTEEEDEDEDDDDEDEDEDDEDDEDEDRDDDSGSDEESSQGSSGSSSSCSSSSASDDDEEEEKRSNRHKPCPPSHVCP